MFVRNSVFNAKRTVFSELKVENTNKMMACSLCVEYLLILYLHVKFEKACFRHVELNCSISEA